MVGFTCFSFIAAREVGCPEQTGRGRTDFVFYFVMRREIQVSVCVGWLPIHINDSNTISSGNQGALKGILTIVFLNSERNFGIGGV